MLRIHILILTFVIAGTLARAEVYFYADRNGTVHFSDYPRSKEFLKYRSKESIPNIPGYDSQYETIIRRSGAKYGIDPALIKAIIRAESNFDSHAISRVGAVGLMQIMPETAMKLSARDILNPNVNIDAGTRYMKILMNEFGGDIKLSLAAYNSGIDNVRKTRTIPPFGETRRFVSKVIVFYKFYRKEGSGKMNNTFAQNRERNSRWQDK